MCSCEILQDCIGECGRLDAAWPLSIPGRLSFSSCHENLIFLKLCFLFWGSRLAVFLRLISDLVTQTTRSCDFLCWPIVTSFPRLKTWDTTSPCPMDSCNTQLWHPCGIDSANSSVEFVLPGRHVKAKPANVELVAKYESSKVRAECWIYAAKFC